MTIRPLFRDAAPWVIAFAALFGAIAGVGAFIDGAPAGAIYTVVVIFVVSAGAVGYWLGAGVSDHNLECSDDFHFTYRGDRVDSGHIARLPDVPPRGALAAGEETTASPE